MVEWESLKITNQEFNVYKTLLKHGASTISFIADKSHMYERSAYDYIERLINKGLVGEIRCNNKRMFLGLNPITISYYIEQQKEQVEKDIEAINEKQKQMNW
jgi:sugar-specific transcriptional regulator TrmB